MWNWHHCIQPDKLDFKEEGPCPPNLPLVVQMSIMWSHVYASGSKSRRQFSGVAGESPSLILVYRAGDSEATYPNPDSIILVPPPPWARSPRQQRPPMVKQPRGERGESVASSRSRMGLLRAGICFSSTGTSLGHLWPAVTRLRGVGDHIHTAKTVLWNR